MKPNIFDPKTYSYIKSKEIIKHRNSTNLAILNKYAKEIVSNREVNTRDSLDEIWKKGGDLKYSIETREKEMEQYDHINKYSYDYFKKLRYVEDRQKLVTEFHDNIDKNKHAYKRFQTFISKHSNIQTFEGS